MNASNGVLRGLMTAGVLTTTLVLAPAAAAGGPAAAGSGSGGAKAAAATTLVFDKNQGDPYNSKLSVYQGRKLIATYRAGSGWGTRVKEDCVSSEGWMPNGNWKIRSKTRAYDGKAIKGYAVYLQDMRCSKKTVTRTEMFIHSEMNRDGSQGRTEPRRWDGAGDYKSNGCVKLNPTDIKKMFRLLDRIGWPTHLRVVA
ncbi:L,D-transpeptidase family protein [Streptomyces pratens]|uniref:L,D-transpeptidase family protein n=1 Tax=Streptomyces pratens TaxID=887456 RepID=A0ABW1M5B9_9ACTN